jgi:Photosynthesis system II assembly factor YCF48
MDAIKKLVSGRLKAYAAGTHPDPELLTAFAENSLSVRDREGMLNHLSACTDCREVLYLALPDPAEAQQVLAQSSASWSWFSRKPRLAMRWATLAASVVILGSVLVTNRGMFTQHLRSGAAPAKDTSQQQVAELKTPPEVDQIAEAPAIKATAKVRPPVKHMTAKPQASMQFDQSGQVHFAAAPSVNEAPQSGNQAAQSVGALPSTTGANEAVAARSSNAIGAAVSKTSSPLSSSSSSTSSSSWSLSVDGQVQRSFDSGKTWQMVPVAGGIQFRAISSIGDDVWAGGAAGTLYHSADSGRSWTKADTAFTGDIAHIEFSDAQNGLVSTADGEVWSTSDGGQSWRLK